MGRIKYTRETLTQEALKSIIHYDSETGKFTWAVGRGQSNAGGRPGSLDRDGYLRIGIDGTYYGAHRLAWLIHYGEWPKGIVDHINRDKLDNRIANLRDTNCSVNGMNTMRASGKSKSGLRGVAYRAETGRWSAKIKVEGKCIWLGTYATPEEAHEVYMKAKATYHHEHFEDSRSSVDHWQQRATRAEAQVEELKENAKRAWEECHATSSKLSKANQDRDRWRECAVYLDYRGADYCVAIHKELDGLQADNAEHREQMSELLKAWKARATRAEADLEIMTRARDHEQDMRRQRQAERDEARGELERVYRWAGCRQCHHDKTPMCESCVVDGRVTRFAPKWNALAECGEAPNA